MTKGNSVNLWLFLELLARRRGMTIAVVLVATVVAIGISLILPKWYLADALLLPPKAVSAPVGGFSKLAEVVSITEGLNLPVMVTPSDLYARMLQSRSISRRIIARFNLRERYDTDNEIETFLALMSHAEFSVTSEGLLRVAVEDRDPQMAADITNAFVDELDLLNNQIVSGRARQNREFIALRLERVRTELDSARQAFEQFQESHRAVDLDEQTRMAIEQAGSLKAKLASIEMEISLSEELLGSENPELQQKKRQREIIKEQLEGLEKGSGDSSYFSLPVASVPRLKGLYEDLYSRVKVNEELYKVLLQQLEQAKIQENEDSPTISVLDRATPPEIRSRPQRTLIVGVTFGLSLLLAILLATFLEYLARLQQSNPEDHRRAMTFIRAYLGWLPGVSKAGKQ